MFILVLVLIFFFISFQLSLSISLALFAPQTRTHIRTNFPHSLSTTLSLKEWSPTKEFADELVRNNTPVILRNAAPSRWAAVRNWQNWSTLSAGLPRVLEKVRCIGASKMKCVRVCVSVCVMFLLRYSDM